MAEKRVSVRLVAEGGRQVRAEFDGVGASGDAAMRTISTRTQAATLRLAAFARVGAAAAGAALVSLGAFAIKGAGEIDRTAKAARRLGDSVLGFRATELAADEAGVSFEQLTTSVQVMDREIARGARGAIDGLASIGLAASDLEGLESDQKLALIADRIATLGLSSGQTSALLQGLGIRSKEMVLALGSGGDALRKARVDIADYGLALSGIQTDRIEQANDRIGRLGLISHYVGQQLAQALVPALGALAQGFTDSLREGGLLRGVIDALVAPVRVVANVIESVVVIGRGLIDWIATAALETGFLRAAFATLGSAIGTVAAVLVAPLQWAYDLVVGFRDLIRGAGGFGEALNALGTLASGVWQGITGSAEAIVPALGSVWSRVQQAFTRMLAFVQKKWGEFLMELGAALGRNKLTAELGDTIFGDGFEIAGKASANDVVADRFGKTAVTQSAEAAQLATAGFERAQAAWAVLSEIMARGRGETEEATTAVVALGEALVETGAKGGAAKAGIDKMADAARSAADAARQFMEPWKNAFTSFITGASSAGEAASQLLRSLATLLANRAFDTLMGGFKGGGGFFKGIGRIFGFANGTSFAPGGLSLVGERGPELVNLPRGSQVFDATRTRSMVGGGKVELVIHAPEGVSIAQVGQIAGNVAVRIVSTAMAQSRDALRPSLAMADLRGR